MNSNMLLLPRKLFGGDTDHTCPPITVVDPVQEPYGNGLTFHNLAMIIAGACTILTCIPSFWLIMRHATHYSMPREQRQIIRVIFTAPVFAIISFLCVAFEGAHIYLLPIIDLYEAFAFSCLFLLFTYFVNSGNYSADGFTQKGLPGNYTKTAFTIFQFPVVMLVLLFTTEITQAIGKFCATSNALYFAHIWVTILTAISTALAVMSILKFVKATRSMIAARKPMSKLFSFKGIVFLVFVQKIVMSFLTSSNDIHPTTNYTFSDITVAVPAMIICAEMVIFSIIFVFVYSPSEYYFRPGQASSVPLGAGGYKGGFLGLRALFQAINFTDVIGAIFGAFSGKFGGANTGRGNVQDLGQYDNIALMEPAHQHDPRDLAYRGM